MVSYVEKNAAADVKLGWRLAGSYIEMARVLTSWCTPNDNTSYALIHPTKSTSACEALCRLQTCFYGVNREE